MIAGCAGMGMFNDVKTSIESNAALVVSVLSTGKVSATGEIIKAALEIYAGRFMPDDYLDYVYKVKFGNESNLSPRIVSSGGSSFQAAEKADSFTCQFPQKIVITLREGLI